MSDRTLFGICVASVAANVIAVFVGVLAHQLVNLVLIPANLFAIWVSVRSWTRYRETLAALRPDDDG